MTQTAKGNIVAFVTLAITILLTMASGVWKASNLESRVTSTCKDVTRIEEMSQLAHQDATKNARDIAVALQAFQDIKAQLAEIKAAIK